MRSSSGSVRSPPVILREAPPVILREAPPVILSEALPVILRSAATKDRFLAKVVELPRGKAILRFAQDDSRRAAC